MSSLKHGFTTKKRMRLLNGDRSTEWLDDEPYGALEAWHAIMITFCSQHLSPTISVRRGCLMRASSHKRQIRANWPMVHRPANQPAIVVNSSMMIISATGQCTQLVTIERSNRFNYKSERVSLVSQPVNICCWSICSLEKEGLLSGSIPQQTNIVRQSE